ncbi:hypothetical protein [Vibrio sp. 03_296]|uniref:hypothetical protein n=1 Tax=Vibrio sp. 03_296 TaxID=2024409 RepID=UPI002D808F97|nr:hypothetical protein [Vibrio sp. 03_296]
MTALILVNAKDATSVTLYYSESGELAFDSASKKSRVQPNKSLQAKQRAPIGTKPSHI